MISNPTVPGCKLSIHRSDASYWHFASVTSKESRGRGHRKRRFNRAHRAASRAELRRVR